jgi:hypothetical protein
MWCISKYQMKRLKVGLHCVYATRHVHTTCLSGWRRLLW